jgi:hypothetical protein
MVAANGKAIGNILTDGAEIPSDALAYRLENFKACASLRGMDADAFSVLVVDRNEDCGLDLCGWGVEGACLDFYDAALWILWFAVV